jgi:hypothetical protein
MGLMGLICVFHIEEVGLIGVYLYLSTSMCSLRERLIIGVYIGIRGYIHI